MSNVALPRENPHLFAHKEQLVQLMAQRHAGRMHHAYMLCGIKGIGKATFAYHMARELLSEGEVVAAAEAAEGPSLFGDALEPPTPPKPNNPHDKESALFRRVAVGSHTDLCVLAPAYDSKKGEEKAEIGVDIARKLAEFFSLTPAESQWRVAIIDAVDQLNNHAANAILKMLEEPPARCILLLICHNPASVLQTIRSRCQTVRLHVPEMKAFERIMHSNGATVPASLEKFYALSAGSPGRAITLQSHDASSMYKDFVLLLKSANEQPLAPSLEQLSGVKQQVTWKNFRYMLELLVHRICVPSTVVGEIFEGENVALASLREQYSVDIWFKWSQAMRCLLDQTDTFHLEKKASLRMLLHPPRLIALQAQVA